MLIGTRPRVATQSDRKKLQEKNRSRRAIDIDWIGRSWLQAGSAGSGIAVILLVLDY